MSDDEDLPKGRMFNMFTLNSTKKDLNYSWVDDDTLESVGATPELKKPSPWPNFMNICPFRAAFSGAAGFVLGGAVGIFFAALGTDPLTMDQRENLDWRRQMKLQWK